MYLSKALSGFDINYRNTYSAYCNKYLCLLKLKKAQELAE